MHPAKIHTKQPHDICYPFDYASDRMQSPKPRSPLKPVFPSLLEELPEQMIEDHESRSPILSIAAVVLATFLLTSIPLAGQEQSRFFPSQEYMTRVLAAPHSPVTSVKLVYNSHGPSEFGNTGEGEVALAASLPL